MTNSSVSQATFGHLPDGREVTQFTLCNAHGMEVRLINYGGIVTHLWAPDRDGKLADVVLGYDDLEPYLKDSPYFGALIGRVGNRIAGGRFELDGESFKLECNDGANHLHGGLEGFDKKLWDARSFNDARGVGVELTLISPDGDQGYPGRLDVQVTYTLTESNELLTEYRAETDKATPVNLTQHSYFNLAGTGNVLDHQLVLNAERYTPAGEGLIPLGRIEPVEDTPFDFRKARPIGELIHQADTQLQLANGGYDHNYVVARGEEKGMVQAARVWDPESGRVLEVFTEEPGFQFYSGNFLDGSLEGKGRRFERHSGFCIEPQHFPDAPNQPEFPSTTLRPGEIYRTLMSFRFSAE
ncbi:aldose epimerase family protein [Marinimicrobium sp. ABcell2]|uniref:aldose epimerase family protein n=1 Tax=Marinimicrobium sp. ABcell2 TaxID=3069751 RepID=UPI0027AF2F2A|nr:aldose epimerase family protein [Marinimicrobium sp. ABcell2]MDQ2075797.1 aldose epimerase family protein [Marinimicrobium sp. ABcell2]